MEKTHELKQCNSMYTIINIEIDANLTEVNCCKILFLY